MLESLVVMKRVVYMSDLIHTVSSWDADSFLEFRFDALTGETLIWEAITLLAYLRV